MKLEKREVSFNGTKLLGIKTDEKIYIVIKGICGNLGIFANSQIKRINRDETLKQGVVKMTLPSGRGNQETNLLELDYLPLWLTGIKANQCKEEIRPYLKEFKLKAKDVLASAFLDNKPKQLALPKPKEHRIIKKYYNETPVMSIQDLILITGRAKASIYYHIDKNKTLIHKTEMAKFKEENPNLPSTLSNITILYKEEVINICKRLKVYNKVKPQISAYFDDIVQEADKVSDVAIKSSVGENRKAEILLQTLPYIAEEDLKNHVAVNIIKLLDNKILEEFETEHFKGRLISSSDEILYRKEVAGHITSLVKTDRPFEEVSKPGLYITNVNGFKYIAEKIK